MRFTASPISPLVQGGKAQSGVGLWLGQGSKLIAIGVLCGMPLAFGATRLLSAMLFGLTLNDAATFGQAGLIIAGAALVACALPAFRALRFTDAPLQGD